MLNVRYLAMVNAKFTCKFCNEKKNTPSTKKTIKLVENYVLITKSVDYEVAEHGAWPARNVR